MTFVASALAWTMGVSAALIVVAKLRPNSTKVDELLRMWSRAWFKMGGVDFSIEGVTVDPSRSYLIVSNHQSNFDIMANLLAVPVPGRFLAKKELYRIPILNGAMKAIGIVRVDRDRHDSGIYEQLNAAANANIQAARSIIVYPEGTRSRDGQVGTFKRGGFAIAVAEQMPVLPVTIAGSRHAWAPGSVVRGGPIVARVGEPIETVGLTKSDVADLAEKVRAQIAGDFAEMSERLAGQLHQ